MRNRPVATVIMPVYNSENYLANSINSVLNQTFKDFRFVIVDDASTDRSLGVINDFYKKDKRITVIKNKNNLGVTKSLNKALRQVNTKYVIRMDADDWSYKTRFAKQIKLMEENKNIVVSGSHIEVCDQKLNVKYLRRYKQSDKEIRKHIFRYSPFAHPATIWRTEIIKKEKYDEKIRYGQDYELYFRIGIHGKFMNLGEPLLKLRMHNKSISAKMSNMQSKLTVKIRKKAVAKLGYKMSNFDKFYNYSQSLLIGLLPVQQRFIIFNFLRKFDFY